MKTTIEKILSENHIGKSRAIISSELEALTNLSGSQIREEVNKLRTAGIPICSGRTGYYLASTQEELDRTVAQLKSRVSQIRKAIKGLNIKLEDYYE